jgi:glucuronosyltransferase/2-hydroxyacylsphingosine 1-beta-galactosyltransferase
VTFSCTSLLAAKLGVPYITVMPGGIFITSYMQPIYANSGRRLHLPNRLPYTPELPLAQASWPLVRDTSNYKSVLG